MFAQEGDRDELAAQVRALKIDFEDTSLRSFLPPRSGVDLTLQQLRVLSALVTTEGGTTGAKLAEMFGVSMASMSKLLDRLESRGMLLRTEDPLDARAKRLTATKQGQAAMRRLIVSRPEFGDEILLELETDDLRALLQGLSAVARSLAARGDTRRVD